jgi:sirohydrochlorin ferrochelatase
MERRPGSAYAFNEPLLETALGRLPQLAPVEAVVVAQLFLTPGRHAGPSGDIHQICQAAKERSSAPKLRITEPIGPSAEVLSVLVDRYTERSQSLQPLSPG